MEYITKHQPLNNLLLSEILKHYLQSNTFIENKLEKFEDEIDISEVFQKLNYLPSVNLKKKQI